MDFLRRYRCLLDIHRYTLQIDEQLIPCCDKNGEPLIINVQNRRANVLPSQSENIVEAHIMTRMRQGLVEGIIEPNHKIVGLMIATSLHRPDGSNLFVRLMNISDQELLIQEGAVIGQFVPVDEVETTSSVDEKQPRFRRLKTKGVEMELPHHLKDHFSEWIGHLTAQEESRLMRLLCKYQHVFSTDDYDVGCTTLVEHDIPVASDKKPVKQNPYRHGPQQEEEIERQVQMLQEKGLIEEGRGAWSSPVALVRKRDQTWRLCIDYRKLHEVTEKDAYPIPRVDDSLDALGGSKWFSTLNLPSRLSVDASEKTTFVTRSGLWQWKVLPFELTSAPSSFE